MNDQRIEVVVCNSERCFYYRLNVAQCVNNPRYAFAVSSIIKSTNSPILTAISNLGCTAIWEQQMKNDHYCYSKVPILTYRILWYSGQTQWSRSPQMCWWEGLSGSKKGTYWERATVIPIFFCSHRDQWPTRSLTRVDREELMMAEYFFRIMIAIFWSPADFLVLDSFSGFYGTFELDEVNWMKLVNPGRSRGC